MNNMDLWNNVSKTDPKYTKFNKNLNGRPQTSIVPMYIFKLATEEFGPVGKGWGYEITEERFDEGAPVFIEKDKIGNEIMHTCLVKVWYMLDGDRCEIAQYGHTPYIMSTKYGLKTDFDAPKKSLTDGIKKALSLVGFAADIFMGEFDDQEYVANRQQESDIERAENKDAEITRQHEEYIAEMSKIVEQIKESKTLGQLNGLRNLAIRKANYRNDTKLIMRIEEISKEVSDNIKGEEK